MKRLGLGDLGAGRRKDEANDHCGIARAWAWGRGCHCGNYQMLVKPRSRLGNSHWLNSLIDIQYQLRHE
jgi:hypothetical protein